MSTIHESTVEKVFVRLGYSSMRGVNLDDADLRAGPAESIFEVPLRVAVERLNPHLPGETIAQVVRTVTTPPHPTLEQNNRWLQTLLTHGVEVEYRDPASCERPFWSISIGRKRMTISSSGSSRSSGRLAGTSVPISPPS